MSFLMMSKPMRNICLTILAMLSIFSAASAFAGYQIKSVDVHKGRDECDLYQYFSVGDIYDNLPSTLSCQGRDSKNDPVTASIISQSLTAFEYGWLGVNGRGSVKVFLTGDEGCPPDKIADPETGKCEDIPFCQSSEWDNIKRELEAGCYNDGYVPGSSYCNSENDYGVTCIDKDEDPICSIDPLHPDCLPDEPTDPDDCNPRNDEWPKCCAPDDFHCSDQPDYCSPDSLYYDYFKCFGNDDPEPPEQDPGDKIPDPENPPVEADPSDPVEEPPVEDTGEILEAITNFNSDVNEQLNDMLNNSNSNHAETEASLEEIKTGVDNTAQAVVDGANATKEAISEQTNILSDVGGVTNSLLGGIDNSINSGFGEMTDALNQGTGELVDAIEGITDIQVLPAGELAQALYDPNDLTQLEKEIGAMKDEYQSIVTDFKNYFSFSGLNNGEFDPHTLSLNWHGNPINEDNVVLKTLVDNAHIIGPIILFLFGYAGVRLIVEQV